MQPRYSRITVRGLSRWAEIWMEFWSLVGLKHRCVKVGEMVRKCGTACASAWEEKSLRVWDTWRGWRILGNLDFYPKDFTQCFCPYACWSSHSLFSITAPPPQPLILIHLYSVTYFATRWPYLKTYLTRSSLFNNLNFIPYYSVDWI